MGNVKDTAVGTPEGEQAKAFVVQEKKERRLNKFFKAAEKTISTPKAKIAEMKQELNGYRSVKGQLKAGSLEKENGELRRRNTLYQSILEKHGLTHLMGGRHSNEV